MNAVVIAGGTPPPEDPLYPYTQGQSKALLDVAGKPMLQWVLDALSGARTVTSVTLIGPAAAHGMPCWKPVHYLPEQQGLLANVQAGIREVAQREPAAGHVLIVSSDIPGITPEMVDWRVEAALDSESDFDYAVVERRVMEARFPGSNRSYVPLRDAEVCGGDMNVVRAATVADERLWQRLVDARKSALRQAALLGFDTLFLLLTRRLTLAQAEKLASKRLGLQGKVRLAPYAEIAMDVDKPHQLELMRRDLVQRASLSS